jgi:hypothetical protein
VGYKYTMGAGTVSITHKNHKMLLRTSGYIHPHPILPSKKRLAPCEIVYLVPKRTINLIVVAMFSLKRGVS